MIMNLLDRLLLAARTNEASDLHLIAGVPPAFRVNGEIILAEEDVLHEDELATLAYGLLNDRQREKFERDWELCISLLHPSAGRLRVTFYRRNGYPELSLRFTGEQIASREELGLPEKIDSLARRPNGLVLVTGPTGAGKTTTLNYLVNLINSERRCKIVTIDRDALAHRHPVRRALRPGGRRLFRGNATLGGPGQNRRGHVDVGLDLPAQPLHFFLPERRAGAVGGCAGIVGRHAVLVERAPDQSKYRMSLDW